MWSLQMVNHKAGNLLEAQENIIVQQVNYQGVMGAGLAKQIKNKSSCYFITKEFFSKFKPSS